MRTDNAAFERFVGAGQGAAGFVLNHWLLPASAAAQSAAEPPPSAEAAPAVPPPPPPISGMRLDKVAEQVREHAPPRLQALLVALALGSAMLGGSLWQRRLPLKEKSAFNPAWESAVCYE